MSDASQRVAGLSPEHLQRLIDRLQGRAPANAVQRIGPRPAGLAPLPASFAQERLWFLEQLEPGTALYHITAGLRLRGRLWIPALAAALDELVARHESLRTTFPETEGRPYQVIAPEAGADLPGIDLSALPEAAREAELGRLAAGEARRPFDLARGPLLRVSLVRLSGEDHAFVCILHHIVSDGWSSEILVRELSALYEAFSAGRPSPLPPLPIQYADYALWQREHLSGDVLAARLAYWRERLAGLPPLAMPTDRSRPAVAGDRGASCRLRLSAGLAERVRALALEAGATPFMVLLAAFEALLARLSGQTDLTVGTPVAGRQRSEVQNLIGFFVNTLVLRADLADEPSFAGLLAHTRRHALEAYAHQDLPFEKLVEELQPGRHLGRTPLFQAFFLLQNAPAEPLRLPGLVVEPLPVESGTAKFDLTLALAEDGDGFAGELIGSADLFEEATIERWAGCFEHLVAAALPAPGTSVFALPLLREAERRTILGEWSSAGWELPAPALIHEVFAEQAARTPGKAAAVCQGTAVTYRELDERAGRLARRLAGFGKPGLVGLMAAPDLPLLTGMLGILKAGSGFVPLDPGLPADRLTRMAADCGLAVLAADRRSLARAEEIAAGARVVCLEDDFETLQPADAGPGDGTAYVIFTSGSTGVPKGVPITHENLVPLLLWSREVFGFGEHTRVLQSLSYAFDFGVFEILTTLLFGGTLYLRGDAERSDVEGYLREVREHAADTLHTTPSFFRAVAAEAGAAGLPTVRVLHLGGEALTEALVAEAFRVTGPECRIFNGYGPTEAAVNCALYEVGRAADWRPRGLSSLPIGHPSAANRLYVLDRRLEPVPPGVPGELLVGGPALSRGYSGRPDLTAARFLPDPFGEPGGRLYRTGDLVRFHPDRAIEFLGRVDNQVKVRGYRIELEEIEAALAAHPEVSACAVVAARQGDGEARLLAYVAARQQPAPGADELCGFLGRTLPAYMIPAVFTFLPELPLNVSGKVDRKALPAPEETAAAERVAPRTPLEELLAGLWQELLGREEVGVRDNFFALGGHSLLATRLLTRVRTALGVDLPVRRLFEAPTIEALAAAIESAEGGTSLPALLRQPRRPGDDPPLSFSQERLWFLDRMDPGAPTYNMPGTVGLTGRLDVAALAAALRGVVERHEVLRTVFRVAGGEPRQHILPALAVGLPVLDLAGLPPALRLAEAERLASEHARHRFDLSRGPLLDAALLRLEAERHHLLVVLHHVICDGWSFTLLVREVGALYAAFAAGRPSPLAELPVQYADFAAWQRERVAASRQTELAYWLDRLGGEVAPLELPVDRPRPAVQTFRGGLATLLLPPGLAGRLTAFGRAHGATLFMTLLAAIKALFHRHSGQDDILVGAPVAGRRAVETESLIGCFLNTLVLRTDLGGHPGFRDLVARVREVTLGAYSHQDVPFEAVLASLPQQRDLSRTPLFQVMVNLLNLPSAEMSLPGLALESLGAATAAPSKLDMTFYLHEDGDGLRIGLVYNADLFDAARMEDVLSQLEAFLDQALERPGEPVGALSLVTAAARAVLPDPAAELSAAWEGAVHKVFARHAGRAPGALAVTDPVESWTYGELDLRSDRLAAFLHASGVGPGGVVAFWAHRSAPLVWGVLGALKAGAAFLMLDPRYPAPRQAQMLGIARPTAWLRLAAADPVPAEIESALDAIGCACRLTLPARAEDPGFLADAALKPPAVGTGPDDVAYVAFTSGSTGVPKGVLGRHGSLSHFIPWLTRRFELTAADRFSMLSGLAHDPLHRDLFTPLQTGAAVVIPDPETMDEPGRLATWMRRAGVTVAHLTPALGQVLTTEAPNRPRVEVPSLRYAFLVGDVLTRRDVARLRRLAPAVTCVNYYGSTETQRAVGYHVAEEDEPREVLPLGRGIPDVQILVLNPAGALAGIGELGEVSMRSPHIALGYLGDPQLTAGRFGADRYRTGDLGRYLPNGEAVFAGRADTQVKIRGFRIELGEIESVLGGFPGVREAVVLARQDRGAELYLAAYVVPAPGAALEARELRAYLRERLPDSMVPATFTLLPELPLTPNRKVDRKALPEPGRGAENAASGAPETDLEREIAAIWQEVLGVGRVGLHDNFFEIGGHSLLLVRLHARLEEALKVRLSLMDLFSHPNVHAQAEHLRSRGVRERRDPLPARRSPAPASGRIAIVGLAGRFPGAGDLEAFWHNLREGVESVSFFSEEELLGNGAPPELLRHPSYVPARAVVDGEDLFDAAFFEISPRQAELMDPQLRFFLETSWHALESAGIDPGRFSGAIGVYGGVTASSYLMSNLLSHPGLLEEVGVGPLLLGTDRDFLTTQVSYKLGLRGPSLDVQTACSTSLVATHLACQALLAGDCDVALAGGVSIKLPQRAGYVYQESGADSSDGHCRAFDAKADGSIYGAGVGLVVLKRLEDALADGDVVHAVILGSGVNNDGSQKVGYTAPSIEGQAAVVAAALARAGVEPATIDYVECHGSGTALGDPIEVTALARAFGDTGKRGSCAIGSVKTNIGHLGAAAGVTGLIKTVLALEHREIPPSLHFETPNPKIDFAASPFRVNDRLSPWPADGRPRRAGVSSLGQGGTNAHVVLEEAPAREPSGPSRPWQLLVLSARTESALEAATGNLAAWLEKNPDASLADAAFTLQVGRRAFPHRRAVVCRGVDEARRILAERDPRRLLTGLDDGGRRPVAFLLSGVGDHYPGMARGLYETEPVFRAALDRCFEILAEGPWRDLREVVFAGGERAAEGGLDLRRMLGRGNGPDEAAGRLHRTLYAQPAVFAVEYALAQLWISWGVEPEALLGYSLGEYVAACLAGVFPLEDALPLVAERARWIEELPAGSMLAVPLPEDEVRARLSPGLDLAAVNSPQLSVVSGPPEEVAALARRLEGEGAPGRQLPTTHAFHSRGMEPLAERLTERVRHLRPAAPQIPLLSNVTGTWMTAGEATDPAYWARHLSRPVRFSDGLAELWKNPSRVLLEVGPGQGLSALALQHPSAGRGRTALPSLPHAHERQDDAAFLLGTLGRLWLAGAAIDWAGLWREEHRHRLELPLYPFERRRFWVEPAQSGRVEPALLSSTLEEEQTPAPSLALHERPRLANAWEAPQNETEAWVAGQIERLLGIAGVGAHDSFFELGGHSLLGTRLLSRLRDGLGVELPIAALFESPTPAELAVRIETARGAAAGAAPPIERLPRTGQEAGLPLSFAQERLWFLNQLQPESPFYNLPVALELRGTLSLPLLAAGLDGVVARHEALRTTFHFAGDRPVQVIAPTLRLALPRVDLDGLPRELRAAEALRLSREEAVRPFDLARGPLVRATVLRLEDEVHVALFNQHHVISDGWSSGILVEEMTACYHAAAAGEPPSLPDLPIQYADYAVWQRGWLCGEVLEERLRWWRERLAGAPHVLDLPTDRPRPAAQSLRGAVRGFALSAELSTGLYELSRRQGATLFMTLASLLAALLSRQTGAEDLLLGSPVAGRDRTETEGLIGVFVNTLVLRAEVAGDPAFSGILGRMREMALGAYAHQDLPFEKLVDLLQLERSLAHTPLFQVLLVLQNAPLGTLGLPGLTLTPLPVESGTARFDLLLSAVEQAGLVAGKVEYNRDLFDAATIDRLLSHLRILAEGAVSRPEARLSELPLLSGPEIQQLRREWNETAPAPFEESSLSRRFEACAESAPGAVAAVFEGDSLSYADLNARANRLARALERLGVRAETRVGICLERSLDLVVAVLGVLKAGGAYVPLDPDSPDERLRFLLQDALGSMESAVLVTTSGWAGRFASAGMEALHIVSLDDGEWLRESPENLAEAPRAEHLAYVIYTSGSAGRPKGVLITHAHVLRLFAATRDRFRFDSRDVWTLFHSYAFDFSVWEIWGALLYGGRLIVVPYWVSRSPEAFHQLLGEQGVTVLNQTPAAFRQLVQIDAERARLHALRLVIFGGEALELTSLAPWIARHGDLRPRLINMYGITETTVHVTFRPVGAADLAARYGGSPLGGAIRDLQLHLLDRHLQPVPIGVSGEICVGGAGLARGYLGRPDLTAERFIPDPWSEEPGQRLYRSGDLASRRPDGDVIYLGRVDFQVKVRGFRIELGEIESILASHPGVRETVVVVRDEAGGERRLAAYVVPRAGTAPEVSGLRAFLAARIPEYMIPAAWVVLDELPLTGNGKVDRRALPAPGAGVARDYSAPRTPLEQVVAGIWAELLKVERVGLTDNFFDLGGDSIKAVRLVSRINERLGADLRVQDVFTHQTVGPMAERIAVRSDRSQAEDLAAGLAEIARFQHALLASERQSAELPAEHEDFYPLSGIEKGMIYHTLLLPEQPIYHDQHAYVLSIPGLDRFYRALGLVIGRHEILRSTFHFTGFEEPLKVVHRSLPIVPDVEDLSDLPAAEQRQRVERYRAEDLRHRFAFRGEVLWRLKLFRLAGDTFLTVWTWHHAILDGWSNLTFWLDLNELLAREDFDRIESLPPLASSYKDYLAISLGRRQAPATEAFWRDTLAGAGRNRLPFHRAATRERSAFGMRSLYRPLSREALLGLRERAAELHVPLQALFLAAHLHLLRLTSGEEDVITGVVSHDRPGIPDGDKIVGCFLNTFPIRFRLRPGETGASAARRVAGFLVTVKEHEIPLVEIAGIVGARESAQNPIFDTLLNFMDFHLIEEVRDNVLFQPGEEAAAREPGELHSAEMTNTLFDLEVMATPVRPFLRIKYLPQRFETADIEQALTLYERILAGLCRDTGAPLGTEALLSGEERGQLVHAYNDTAREYPRHRPLHSFFEEQAALHPERAAVVCGGRALTYGEIERQSNRLARHLLAQGVRPGDNVGVCFERDPELVVALLGVLKAGAAYVPMEPSYPAARKEHIVRQSAVSLVLTELPGHLDGFSGAPVPVRPWPDSLAYTIYTSGSTGTPKGVMIEHHSAANLIAWVNREFEVGPETRALMLSSVCFDLSVYDVFGALGAGASLVIARQPEIQDPAALLRLVVERKVTFWSSVPSTLGLLVQYLEETDPGFRGEDLRVAFLSGDWIPLSLPERARRFFPGLRVISLGGATEATVWSIFHPVLRIDEAWASIPYGKPLDNNTFYILDRHLELVPPGVVGDLYIGGVGVARGYAGDPEKTAASYLPDPFGSPGGRLYRTGDLGRMLPEGEIEFLGRSDHQVKIRGFRVELGEIESQLSRAPGVREAVVLARADRAGQKYLCGYVVASGASEDVSVVALQEHLAGTLPGYMIPDTFVFLSELPLTPNGKIDRKALPEPEAARAAAGDVPVPPAGATEMALVEIWEEVLGLSGIGTGQDFFALGGHSLSAIQVVTRVRRRFDVELPLPDFFENPTVARLAAWVETAQQAGAGRVAPPLLPVPREGPAPLSYAQERLWFLYLLEPESPAFHLGGAVRLTGAFVPGAFAASLREVVRRHEVLRTRYRQDGDGPVQIVDPAAPFELPLLDLGGLPEGARESELRRLAEQEMARPFDLTRDWPLRSRLVRLSREEHAALFILHHIAGDGWSLGLLNREVSVLYATFTAGPAERPPALPEPAVQYADFAVWQRGWLRGEPLEAQLDWWRSLLAGPLPALELPQRRDRPETPRFRGAACPVALPADLRRSLEQIGHGEGATLFMTLLAGFKALLHLYSGQEDLLVGTNVANRDRGEIEGMIGFFVNNLALRTDLSGDPGFRELVRRVRDMTLGAFAHQEVPFEKVLEAVQPRRQTVFAPLFQVMFVLQNLPAAALQAGSLKMAPLRLEARTVSFELTLMLSEEAGGLSGALLYDTDLFDEAAMTRMAEHLLALLHNVALDPDCALSEIPLTAETDIRQLASAFSEDF